LTKNSIIGIRQTDNPHKVVGLNRNKLHVFINPRLNEGMVGPKTDIDIDNRHGPKSKSGELLCSHGKGHNSHPLVGPCLLWPNGCPSHQLLSSC